jgi:bisphosphoglycerate-independent phosphoglycerate mutase (AlkP superfamily)
MLTAAEVALIVAAIALIGTAITVIQKRYTDRRDAWWDRTQWALKCVVTNQDDVKRTVGLTMLEALQSSSMAADHDRKMIEDVADAVLALLPVGERPSDGINGTTGSK